MACTVRYWVVRVAGGELIEPCRIGKYVAIGWNELGDLNWLSNLKISEDEAKKRLYNSCAKKYRKMRWSKTQIDISVSQVYRFVREIKRDDFVLSPTNRRTVLIGRVVGEYYFQKEKDHCRFKQRKRVDWVHEIARDDMSQELRNSLGAHLTVFKLHGHDEELGALVEGKRPPIKPRKKYAEKDEEESIVGETINFRGLVYAPTNEQGVIFLFSKVSKDLNIEIEEIRTGFPDAVGRVKTSRGRPRRTIEFEYRSSHYDHLPAKCDMLVCWEHDWTDCPKEIEVISLKDVIKELRE